MSLEGIKGLTKKCMIDILEKKFQYPVNKKRDRKFIGKVLSKLCKQHSYVEI